jgi:hypothetical protein
MTLKSLKTKAEKEIRIVVSAIIGAVDESDIEEATQHLIELFNKFIQLGQEEVRREIVEAMEKTLLFDKFGGESWKKLKIRLIKNLK